MNIFNGFSKLTRQQKIEYIQEATGLSNDLDRTLAPYRHPEKQALFDDFSENTLSNFFLPFGVAPNFLINGKNYIIPMVTEESSVVAAASRAASFWAQYGGFKVTVHDTEKIGQIWFQWEGDSTLLSINQHTLSNDLKKAVSGFTESMELRGGGITGMKFISQPEMKSIWQLQVNFKTADSMGANFINSCLEQMKQPLAESFKSHNWPEPEIIMAILSNYTPQCLVTCETECNVNQLASYSAGIAGADFARRFKLAVDIASHNTHRAVTHNKGIFNGIDAIIIATGNDFRAIEAAGHAYAALNGHYKSLSECHLTQAGSFQFKLTLPLALGTVGGLTKLHPLSLLAMEILQNPTAKDLMGVVAAVGLANNFAAVASLVTIGIQKGHMKLHLPNILNSLNATEEETIAVQKKFQEKTVSHKEVTKFIEEIRKNNTII